MTRTRYKTVDITTPVVFEHLARCATPVTARTLAIQICRHFNRSCREADRGYVREGLKALEQTGHARRAGEEPPARGVGRASVLWVLASQPDLPTEAAAN